MLSARNEFATTEPFEFAALRAAENYRGALIREFSPHLHGSVLEVGAGIGQLTALLRRVPTVEHLLSLEPDGGFCAQLRQTMPDQEVIQGTIEDLPAGGLWNAIVSVNVLEHIGEDERELRRYARVLSAAHGALCLFVPARRELYAPIDRDFGHWRRYTRPELQDKLGRAGFRILCLHYFNAVGYLAWWLNFRVLRQRHFSTRSVRWFDRVIFPAVHGWESRVMRPPIGQSLLAVALAV